MYLGVSRLIVVRENTLYNINLQKNLLNNYNFRDFSQACKKNLHSMVALR